MRAPPIVLKCLVFTGLSITTGCLHRYDPQTLTNLGRIRTLPAAEETQCQEFVQYETAKQSYDQQKYDPNSVTHVRDACDCLKNSASRPEIARQSCLAALSAYEVYEKAKKEP